MPVHCFFRMFINKKFDRFEEFFFFEYLYVVLSIEELYNYVVTSCLPQFSATFNCMTCTNVRGVHVDIFSFLS